MRQRVRDVKPYSCLAEIYDYVMRHVDYERWARYLDQLFTWVKVEKGEVLDISCGTGMLDWHLHLLGYRPVIFDVSTSMVRKARKKFDQRDVQIPVWVSDMRHFAVQKPFAAIVCIYDSINYLKSPADWESTLDNVAAHLGDGGVFIMDVCTEFNSLRNFRNYKDQDSGPGFRYSRKSRYQKDDQMQINEFSISFSKTPRESYREVHTQRIYTLNEVDALVQKSPLVVKGMFDDFTMDVGTESSERVHFVLEKEH